MAKDVKISLSKMAKIAFNPKATNKEREKLAKFVRQIKRERSKPVVYFVGYDDYVKIGVSTEDGVKERISQIQTSCPRPLTVYAITLGDRDLEQELHKKFAAHRLSGEWFSRHQDIIDYLNHMQTMGEVEDFFNHAA